MKLDAEDFREQYAGMLDSELLSLRPDDLIDVARQCWTGEIARRGLKPPVHEPEVLKEGQVGDAGDPPPDPESGDPKLAEEVREEEEELAPAAIFRNRRQANAERGRLQSAFIPTFLESDEGSYRLLVPASYLERAREVLSSPDEGQ